MAPKKNNKNEVPKRTEESDSACSTPERERKKPAPKRAKKSAPQMRADDEAVKESAVLLRNALARSEPNTPNKTQPSQGPLSSPSPAQSVSATVPQWGQIILPARYDVEGIPERYRNCPFVLKCTECSLPGKPNMRGMMKKRCRSYLLAH